MPFSINKFLNALFDFKENAKVKSEFLYEKNIKRQNFSYFECFFF